MNQKERKKSLKEKLFFTDSGEYEDRGLTIYFTVYLSIAKLQQSIRDFTNLGVADPELMAVQHLLVLNLNEIYQGYSYEQLYQIVILTLQFKDMDVTTPLILQANIDNEVIQDYLKACKKLRSSLEENMSKYDINSSVQEERQIWLSNQVLMEVISRLGYYLFSEHNNEGEI